ncbi:GTP 3',8-cyclase 1 [subsurface metagenome]
MEKEQRNNKLIKVKDSFGRIHNYLRLSLTDRCNLRCSYCMPAKPEFMPGENLLNANEIEKLVSLFVELGINKIRLTGGEPLIRKDFREIAEKISQFNASLHLTTNGFYLDDHIEHIAKYFSSVNISLDTLKPGRFLKISQKEDFSRIHKNIDLALSKGIRTKLNVVVIREMNHDEIIDFIKLTLINPIEVRFIEFMPFKGNHWNIAHTYTSREMLLDIKKNYEIVFLGRGSQETSERFRVVDSAGSFGFISTVSHPFCSQCNRIRITADGKLKNCLFGREEYDLFPLLGNSSQLKRTIYNAFSAKHFARGTSSSISHSCLKDSYSHNRCMTAIGG